MQGKPRKSIDFWGFVLCKFVRREYKYHYFDDMQAQKTYL